MNTIKELYSEAKKIISEVFCESEYEIINITVNSIINSYLGIREEDNLYISCSYFVKHKRKNIHGDVNSSSIETVLEKLTIKANFDKENLRIEQEAENNPTSDILIEK